MEREAEILRRRQREAELHPGAADLMTRGGVASGLGVSPLQARRNIGHKTSKSLISDTNFKICPQFSSHFNFFLLHNIQAWPQGTKCVIQNLQTSVTQEDIEELFGDIGALKKAKVWCKCDE